MPEQTANGVPSACGDKDNYYSPSLPRIARANGAWRCKQVNKAKRQCMNHNNVWTAVSGYVISAAGYFMWFITNYYVLAVLGFVALIVGIYASVMTIVEKRMSIRQLRKNDRN